MLERPAASIAVAAGRAPALAQHHGLGVVWCRTVPELIVLTRTGKLQAALVDRDLPGIGLDLIASLRPWCTVLVIDGRSARPCWERAGATVLPLLPAEPASLETALADARRDQLAATPPDRTRRGALITVVEAPGGGGIEAAAALARSIAATHPGRGRVVLADLTLDGLHRTVHGLGPEHLGVPELVAASRFAPPSAPEVEAALHPIGPGLALLPGLRHHHGWVSVGPHSAAVLLDVIRARAAAVVAHVDGDLEGEADTGSFDIEDRNVLARTAVRGADVVVVSGRSGPAGRVGLLAGLAGVAAFCVPDDRTLALATGSGRGPRRRWRVEASDAGRLLHRTEGERADLRLGQALHAKIASLTRDPDAVLPPGADGLRVVPGALGHWAHDMAGWITPRVPQQP